MELSLLLFHDKRKFVMGEIVIFALMNEKSELAVEIDTVVL